MHESCGDCPPPSHRTRRPPVAQTRSVHGERHGQSLRRAEERLLCTRGPAAPRRWRPAVTRAACSCQVHAAPAAVGRPGAQGALPRRAARDRAHGQQRAAGDSAPLHALRAHTRRCGRARDRARRPGLLQVLAYVCINGVCYSMCAARPRRAARPRAPWAIRNAAAGILSLGVPFCPESRRVCFCLWQVQPHEFLRAVGRDRQLPWHLGDATHIPGGGLQGTPCAQYELSSICVS